MGNISDYINREFKLKLLTAFGILICMFSFADKSFSDVQINTGYLREDGDKSEFDRPVCDAKYRDDGFWRKKTLNVFTCNGKEYMGGDVYCKEAGAANEAPVIATPVCLHNKKNLKSPTRCARAEIPLRCRELYNEKFEDDDVISDSGRRKDRDLEAEDSESENDKEESVACSTCASKMHKIFKEKVLDRVKILCNDEGDSAEKVLGNFKKTAKAIRTKLKDSQCSTMERSYVQSMLKMAWMYRKDKESDRCRELLKEVGKVLKDYQTSNDDASSGASDSEESGDSDDFDAIQ